MIGKGLATTGEHTYSIRAYTTGLAKWALLRIHLSVIDKKEIRYGRHHNPQQPHGQEIAK